MKTLIIAFILCCLGCVATPIEPEEQSTSSVAHSTTVPNGTEDLLTDNPMTEINSSGSPLSPQSFISGAFSAFTVIIVSELGDKTFFIAVVLAFTCSPLCVFAGSISALALMTLLSAGLGLVTTFIPHFWVQCVAALLFIIFGLKMLREGYLMKNTTCKKELEVVQKDVDSKLASKGKSKDVESGKTRTAMRWVFLEAFVMTFLAEWGDRSQITTALLAAKDSIYGVVVGAILGHAACTLLAVLGGRIVSERISLRIGTHKRYRLQYCLSVIIAGMYGLKFVTLFGALLFFVFAIITVFHAVQEYMKYPLF